MDSVRAGYEKLGVEGYYKLHSEDYNNHHFYIIKDLLSNYILHNDIGNNILDMCCGSGEVTSILIEASNNFNIEGLDPYTSSAYIKNTGLNCMKYNFTDILKGQLLNKRYDTIICSFALHLCDETMLSTVLYQLSLISNKLIIITPHKRPEINSWWKEIYNNKKDKVTIRVYERTIKWM